jgi:hypothetical protein
MPQSLDLKRPGSRTARLWVWPPLAQHRRWSDHASIFAEKTPERVVFRPQKPGVQNRHLRFGEKFDHELTKLRRRSLRESVDEADGLEYGKRRLGVSLGLPEELLELREGCLAELTIALPAQNLIHDRMLHMILISWWVLGSPCSLLWRGKQTLEHSSCRHFSGLDRAPSSGCPFNHSADFADPWDLRVAVGAMSVLRPGLSRRPNVRPDRIAWAAIRR